MDDEVVDYSPELLEGAEIWGSPHYPMPPSTLMALNIPEATFDGPCFPLPLPRPLLGPLPLFTDSLPFLLYDL